MQDLLGREITAGMCALKVSKGQQPLIGFFYLNRNDLLKFVTLGSEYNGKEKKSIVRKSIKMIHDHDQYLTFDYSAEKIDYLFSAESAILYGFREEDIKEAKEFFIELCSRYNVEGTPNFQEMPLVIEEANPDYLELD